MLPYAYQDVVDIRRRTAYTVASRDALNNPVYGNPPSFPKVYSSIKVKIALSGKRVVWARTGELVYPEGTLYYSKDYTLQTEDRIVTVTTPGVPTGIEYIVTNITPAFILHGVVDHYEAALVLPL